MRLLLRILLPAIVLMAVSLSAAAAGHDRALPLQVNDHATTVEPAAGASASGGATALHDVVMGGRTVSIRVRYGDRDLFDATALADRLGAQLHMQGDSIIFDRPGTGERVHLHRPSGAVRIDGARAGQVDPSDIHVSRRIWLTPDAVEALTGETLEWVGQDRPRPSSVVSANDQSAGQAELHQALLAPRLKAPAPEARLMLASMPSPPTVSREQPTDRSGSGLPQMRSFEGALGGGLSEPRSRRGQADWRSQNSWAVVPDAVPQVRKVQLAAASTQSAAQPVEQETTSSIEVAKQKIRRTKANGVNRPATNRPAVTLAAFAPTSAVAPDAKRPEPRADAAALPSGDEVEPYRGTDVLYADDGYAPPQPSQQAAKVTAARSSGMPREPVETEAQGEIRGRIVFDTDADGAASNDDQRIEGEVVQLIRVGTGVIAQRRSAAFGQFGFDGLSAGRYRLRVMAGWQEYRVDVELSDDRSTQLAAILIATDAPPDGLHRYN